MGLLEYLPTRSETEHADAARDEAEAPPWPPVDDDEMERWMQWTGAE